MLKQQIQSDATDALKRGDQIVSGTLRMLLASVTAKEKEKRYKIFSLREMSRGDTKEEDLAKESELTDEDITDVVFSEIKKRKDAVAFYEKGNRPGLAEKEKKEAAILKKYLPEQLSEKELGKLVEESIARIGAKEIKDMGKVMADLNPKTKGKADGGDVSKIVKDLLSK